MNNKANKSQIQFPPLLNLCNDRPHVDSTFRNWEKNNSPYLNDMISPVYLKENGYEAVYDEDGNKHQIIDGYWKINDDNKISVPNKRYNIYYQKETFNDYDLLAFNTMGNGFAYVYVDSNNSLKLGYYNFDSYSHYTPITIMAATPDISDIKLKDGILAMYVTSDTDMIYIYKVSISGGNISLTNFVSRGAVWYRQTASVSNASIPTFTAITPDKIFPVSNIAVVNNQIWVSWVSNYGKTLNSRDNGFITYYLNNSGTTVRQIGRDLLPYAHSQSICYTYNLNFDLSTSYTSETKPEETTNLYCLNCNCWNADPSSSRVELVCTSGDNKYYAPTGNAYTYVYYTQEMIDAMCLKCVGICEPQWVLNASFTRSWCTCTQEYSDWTARRNDLDSGASRLFGYCNYCASEIMSSCLESAVASNEGFVGAHDTTRNYFNIGYLNGQVSLCNTDINWRPYCNSNSYTVQEYCCANSGNVLCTMAMFGSGTRSFTRTYNNPITILANVPDVHYFGVDLDAAFSSIMSSTEWSYLSSAILSFSVNSDSYTTERVSSLWTQSGNTFTLDLKSITSSDIANNGLAALFKDSGSGTISDITLTLTNSYNSSTQTYTLTRDDTTEIDFNAVYDIINVIPSVVPNVILDDGTMWTMFDFQQSLSSNVELGDNVMLILSGKNISVNGSSYNILNASATFDTGTDNKWVIRSVGYVFNQNFASQTVKMSSGAIAPSELRAGTAENASAKYISFYNSSTTGMRYLAGMSRWSGYNYYTSSITDSGVTGNVEDNLVYNTIGSRVSIDGTDWSILYNTTTNNTTLIQALSYAQDGDDYIGTLITPWSTVSEREYVSADNNHLLFKDYRGYFNVIELKTDTPRLYSILGGKFVMTDAPVYYNLWCAKTGKFYHVASDWNFRVCFGQDAYRYLYRYSIPGSSDSSYTYNIKAVAATQNRLFLSDTSGIVNMQSYNPVGSIQSPYYSKTDIITETPYFQAAYEPVGIGEKTGVEYYANSSYYSSTSGTNPQYQYTYRSGSKLVDAKIINTTYSNTSTVFNTSVFDIFINGAGNNDLVETYDGTAYSLIYYDNYPTMSYRASTGISRVESMFVIQGQFYAIIDNKICNVTYSSGAIASKDPIIDITGMKFVGNNPMIAFFWSERYRSFYSFTGDADLSHIYNANKFYDLSGNYYYDESTQSIFVPTDKGLLVFGPKNTYLLEQFTNTTNVMFSSDNITHIEDNGTDYSMTYYATEGYEVNNVVLESSFYGTGATESTSIDRWNITLYDLEGTHPSGEVKVSVRSLTDITVKSEEKTIKITPDMWDRWSNSILITYNPKLIKGQGIRIYVNSPFIIQSITAHVMDNGIGTLSNKRSMV